MTDATMGEDNSDYDDLIERMKQSEKTPVSADTAKKINKKELSDIYRFFTSINTSTTPTYTTIAAAFRNLKPGASLSLDKKMTTLARTITLIRNDNGEYEFIIELKSKLAETGPDGRPKKDLAAKNKREEGTIKKLTNAYRLDTHTPQANLVIKSFTPETVEELKKESEISKIVKHKRVAGVTLGPVKKGKSGAQKMSVYAKRALSDLESFMKTKEFKKLPIEQKRKLCAQILDGLKAMHAKGYIHQDIKPANILVYKKKDGSYSVKITDFGLSENENMTYPLGTPSYTSPEIFSLYVDKKSPYHDTFHGYSATELSGIFGYANYAALTQENYYMKNLRKFSTTHKKNDMYSAGLVLFEIMHGKYPTSSVEDKLRIENDPVLKGLLAPKREERLDAQQTLDLMSAINDIHEALLSATTQLFTKEGVKAWLEKFPKESRNPIVRYYNQSQEKLKILLPKTLSDHYEVQQRQQYQAVGYFVTLTRKIQTTLSENPERNLDILKDIYNALSKDKTLSYVERSKAIYLALSAVEEKIGSGLNYDYEIYNFCKAEKSKIHDLYQEFYDAEKLKFSHLPKNAQDVIAKNLNISHKRKSDAKDEGEDPNPRDQKRRRL